MPSSTLLSLFRYKAWADGELLDALATLEAAQDGEAHHTALRIFNHIHVVDAIFKTNLLGERHGFTAPIPRRRRPWRCCAAPSASWMPGIWITLPT